MGRSSTEVRPTTRLLGYDLAEFVGRNAFEFIHTDDQQGVVARLTEVMAQPRARVGVAARVRHKNGNWRYLEGVFTNLLDDPTVAAIVNNYRDVTDRRNLEEQVILAQKMEAIGRLAGGVAHDFNNILTAIGGYTDLLLADLPENDRRRHDVEEICQAAQRAAGLTQQLLAFSRQQVMQPKGGRLTIETRNVELDESYAADHPSVTPGCYVLLAVTDTGVGMDEETKAHIFRAVFHHEGARQRNGPRPSDRVRYRESVGRHVWPYSEPGRGTTMRVYLPRVDVPADPIERPGEAAPGALQGGETVLLVEDEEPVRCVTRQLLERNGYTVLEAGDGPAALTLVGGENGSVTFDLLLTDVVMPG